MLLAGGMGTRLGSNNPKGMYNIGKTKDVYIFQRLIENLLEVVNLCGKFIPLLAVLSWWYDDKANLFRCCGESVLKSNLLDEIFENVPHYYIIGITLEKQKTK